MGDTDTWKPPAPPYRVLRSDRDLYDTGQGLQKRREGGDIINDGSPLLENSDNQNQDEVLTSVSLPELQLCVGRGEGTLH